MTTRGTTCPRPRKDRRGYRLGERMPRLDVSLRADQLEALKRRAGTTRSLSEVLREVLDEHARAVSEPRLQE